jgi:hypothetical protein
MKHRELTPAEEQALIESTERGEWKSIGDTEARRRFWRESARNTLRELEQARAGAVKLLVDAIERHHTISFTYANNRRAAEPYILGYDRKRKLVLTAVQTSGGNGVGFRVFDVERMSELTVMPATFDAAPAYNSADPRYPGILARYQDKIADYKERLADYQEVLAKAA